MSIEGINHKATPLVRIFTLVIWCACLAVGIAGFCLRYHTPSPIAPPPETVQAQLLTVPVTQEPAAAPTATPAPESAPPINPVLAAPPLPAVAAPTPAIAFALPMQGPTRTVDAAHASFAHPDSKTLANPIVRRLIFGQGEGAQPAPDYPPDALAAGEEGAVGVRFTVGQDGHVTGTKVASPSRWPLLNNAALQVIQDQWRFTSGAARTYEVVIRFQINR